ncbi:MAG: ABC transporter ATP-binding protein [Spirochaetaceae bacterium]|jgi:oligopeptide/dipeptide ABC transporter ATP-binding protein|nr:ABC transporter ATP-binding protein [Spirochaetaceae bacterium]
MSTETLLDVRGLKKYFPLSRGRLLRAVDDVSFRVNHREILGIVGESGCGKSTLGRLVLRLMEPTAGQVLFTGADITALNRHRLSPIRGTMQMVFQNPFGSFNPKIRIAGALMEVCRYYGMSREEGSERIAALFADIGLSGDLLNRWPQELSGGQLQRLAITRALLSDPALLVADEPLSALDVSVQAQLLNLLLDLRKSRNLTMLFISHDMTVVEYLCDRVAVMYLGQFVETAPAEELFGNTRHPYTRSLITAVPKLDAAGGRERPAPKGETPSPAEEIPGCAFAPRCPSAESRCLRERPPVKEAVPGHLVRCFLIP